MAETYKVGCLATIRKVYYPDVARWEIDWVDPQNNTGRWPLCVDKDLPTQYHAMRYFESTFSDMFEGLVQWI